MKQSILEFITDKDVKGGLLLADMPTGDRKTYSEARVMFEYIANIFFWKILQPVGDVVISRAITC